MPNIPQAPATTDFANNFLTINGLEIIGFGNAGGVTFAGALQISTARRKSPGVQATALASQSLC